MAIIATTKGNYERELLQAGTYIARCYQMIQIGTVKETFDGEEKIAEKVKIGFELPHELRVFKEENGEQPMVFSKQFTSSMHEKSSLRGFLTNWRGKNFSESEAERFDVTKLLGVPCMLNIIHKVKRNGDVKAEIGGVSPLMKGMTCPDQINPIQVLSYDSFDWEIFNKLPDWLKDKMRSSVEFASMNFVQNKPQEPKPTAMASSEAPIDVFGNMASDDLPF